VNLKESCTSWRGLMTDAELGDTPKRQRRDRIAWHERNIAGANTAPRATCVRGSSRAIAVVATGVFLPLAELKRAHSRTCAFQAMLRMLRGRSLSRSRKVSPHVVTGRAFRQNEAEKSHQLLRGCKAPYICQPPRGKIHPAGLGRLP
jgi:hypothetical protein